MKVSVLSILSKTLVATAIAALCGVLTVTHVSCGKRTADRTNVENNITEPQDSINKISFSLPDINGNIVSAEDVWSKNKITIIDFWASWCGPCRSEMPNLVRLYDTYHDKGLEIIGVSLDEDKQQWETAIDKLGIKWLQLSDLKGWENAVARQFDVNSIPYTIIVDNKGQTLATDLRGESLQTFIAERLD